MSNPTRALRPAGFACGIAECRRLVMDGPQFDGLVKAVTARGSRRRVLKSLVGGLLGVGALGTMATHHAAAATYCQCLYFCSSHGTIFQCERGSFCPGGTRYRGVDCSILDNLQCGFPN